MRTVGTLLLLMSLAGAARATPAASAREHYKRATAMYDLEHYADAAHEYERAYALRPDPVLLYNIGQMYRLAGDPERAIAAYRSLVERFPKSPTRKQAEAHIAALTGQLADEQELTQHAAAEPRPAKATPPPPLELHIEPIPTADDLTPTVIDRPAPNRTMKIAGTALSAAGVAALAAGVGLIGSAYQSSNAINTAPAGTPFDPELERRVHLYEPLGISFAVIGGVALAAGITLAVIGSKKAPRPILRASR
jgi:tetratricopeptide (TPR) repeat protein